MLHLTWLNDCGAVFVDFTRIAIPPKSLNAASSLTGVRPWVKIAMIASLLDPSHVPKSSAGKKMIADFW